ncbi:hypothetical protein B566_EDAN017447 [Ephemera danica]|nr:hypothetical protein B566_EDAN017447 [Ephemera danica]
MPDEAEECYYSNKKDRTAADLIQKINAKNAKILAFVIVLSFIGYHGILHLKYDSRIRQLYEAFLAQLESGGGKSTMTHEIASTHPHTDLSFGDAQLRLRVQFIWSPVHETRPPSVIVAGAATWSIKESNASHIALTEYTTNLTRLVQAIDAVSSRRSRVFWALQEPVNVEKLHPARSMITNEQIDLYNKAAMEILLNMYCNDHMNYNDGTCCSSAEPATTLQVLTAVLACALWLRGRVQSWRRARLDGRGLYSTLQPQLEEPSELPGMMGAIARLLVIMAYFYLCDRTNFFMKENKYFSQVGFWLPVGYVFALGLFFTEDSRFTKVLHRDQTDEWKGWMQLVILVYHLTGASGVLPIYMHVRVMVSSYLFLSGYGHFCYFWQRGDAGLVRFLQVMFRLNFLTVALCLCMNRPYQFYYFVPLVSFWFLMVYLVLALPPHVTAASSDSNPLHYLYLVLKLVGLFSVITVLYMSEVFFEKVFVTRPWKALFVTTDDDIHEWWFRWKLDRYRFQLLDDNNHSNLVSPGIALSATLASLIVSYVVLRNISGVLRTRFSSFFAWFGRISLELFVCQSHVWLAADTHGVLVLLPGYPVLNSFITSFVFVCASHELHKITRILVPYAVPQDWKLALRNLLLFLAILVPIAIDGKG